MASIGNSLRTLWVICELKGQLFGIDCRRVKEMVIAPSTAKVPDSPACVRGVFTLRGAVIPLVDLRTRLGMASTEEERDALCSTMAQRAQEHSNWVTELEASIREQREFKLARDPHKCAFGRWYDTYKSNDLIVSNFLTKFDAPHRRIHELADEVDRTLRREGRDAALALVEAARNHVLKGVMVLFAQFEAILRDQNREVAVVIDSGTKPYAVCVDSIASVEHIPESTFEELALMGLEQSDGLVLRGARRSKTDQLVLLLNDELLLTQHVSSNTSV